MGKKRPHTIDRRAQITIFMIIGLLLFFTFLFVIYLSSSLELNQLSTQQEQILTKTFKKESLRLYVDDCLQDELERGLILLGKQGTVWADQPGGAKQFSEGINGITYGDERIAYAIVAEHYDVFPHAYPCDEDVNSPAFCQYHYPNTTAGFGTLKLFPSTFSDDLQHYLLNRTAWCVQSFILTNVSQHAEIMSTDIDLELAVGDEGISVKVNYPLKFTVGREEIFHLSAFDFFYPSQFKRLLDTVASPLTWDQKFVDFNYTPETFTQSTFTYASEQNVGLCVPSEDYFLCDRALAVDTYQSLGISMTNETITGNDIFTFIPALYTITNTPEPYQLRIARQNRPPALEYIERASCPAEGYDYLVIKDHSLYGDINLAPRAIDPDEDNFAFTYASARFGEHEGPTYGLTLEEVARADIPSGLYNITTTVVDEHGKNDSQEVRLLIDRPIQLGLSLEFPYADIPAAVGGNRYVVSKEDPVIVRATIPEQSVTLDTEELTFHYNDGVEQFSFRGGYREIIPSTTLCYNVPLREGEPSTCDVTYYNTDEKFTRVADASYYTFHPFQRSTSLERLGRLIFNFHQNYCGLTSTDADSSIEVLVKECVPHQNQVHPFAYPYHGYTFDAEQNFIGNDPSSANPFEATHSCCVGSPTNPTDWRLATAEDDPCFVNPEPGCYGGLLGYTSGTNKGYILEEEQVFCSGTRGNICDGPQEWQLTNEEMRCGTNGAHECSGIDERCEGQLAFGFVEGGWCSGRMGCASVCTSAVVYHGSEESSYFTSEEINGIAIENQITTESEMTDFKCGCTNSDNGRACDANFDSRFDGVCTDGNCVE